MLMLVHAFEYNQLTVIPAERAGPSRDDMSGERQKR